MVSWAPMFVLVGLTAGLFGVGGVAAMSSEIAWSLLGLGLLLLVLHVVRILRLPPAV